MSDAKREYSGGGDYWERKNAFVMGDIRQRPDLLKLIGDVQGKKVLEGGCGTGYFLRKIVALGAEVYGCDIEQGMLDVAKAAETQQPLGIAYELCDITKTTYRDNFFDAVVSVGVLFHLDRNAWKRYLAESRRILKPQGELLMSIEHPFLFTKFSPTRTGKPCWAMHTPHCDADYDESQKFEERYFKSDGEVYTTTLWHHPLEFIFGAIIEAGFSIKKLQEIMVKKEDLMSEFWGTEYGYPGFLQFQLVRNL